MNADQWINEFTPPTQNAPTTVLHASNVSSAPAAAPRPDSNLASEIHADRSTYTLGAMCIAGVVGFVLGRSVIR